MQGYLRRCGPANMDSLAHQFICRLYELGITPEMQAEISADMPDALNDVYLGRRALLVDRRGPVRRVVLMDVDPDTKRLSAEWYRG